MRHAVTVPLLALLPALLTAQEPLPSINRAPLPPAPAPLPRQHAPRPTRAPITAADLQTRLFIYADDSMQGRETGSAGHDRALRYIERELTRLGLQPMGDGGGWRQRVPLTRRQWTPFTASVDGRSLTAWDDLVPIPPPAGRPGRLDGARLVWGGGWADAVRLPDSLIAGRVVVVNALVPPTVGTPTQLAQLGRAAAIVIALRAQLPAMFLDAFRGPAMAVRESNAVDTATTALQVITTRRGVERLFGTAPESLVTGTVGGVLRTDLRLAQDTIHSWNVLAMLPGRDPALRAQVVAVGAHSDHLGFDRQPVDHDSLMYVNRVAWWMAGATAGLPPLNPRDRASIRVPLDSLRALRPARPDSIFNGADDDGSGSMALLEIAENLARAPRRPRRSILFAWHTGEERGLLGSRWLSEHFVVPRDSIVAQVNIDMIGRGLAVDVKDQGGDRYVGLVGSRRLSTAYGALIDSLNAARRSPFTIDYRLDADGHPENVYCRSDHYQYARWGIPVAFFSTGLFGDYHQRTDEPQYIAYGPYAARTNFIRDVVVTTADRRARPVVDRPRPDPAAACKQ